MPDTATDTLTLLARLFQTEMSLKKDHVFVYNQKWVIPTYEDIFLVVGLDSIKPFGVNVPAKSDEDQLVETQIVNCQERCWVELFSRDSSAQIRSWELAAVMKSFTAQRLCDDFAIKFGWTSSIHDLSTLEGASMLNRYRMDIHVLRAHVKTKAVAFFDKFGGPYLQVDDKVVLR